MLDINISSLSILGYQGTFKISSYSEVNSPTSECPMIEISQNGIQDLPRPGYRRLTTSGIYVIPKGVAYGSLFVEYEGKVLKYPDLLPEYFAAQLDEGTIDVEQQRAARFNQISISDPCIFLNSTSHWVYGHWLLDIWPRLWSAANILGQNLLNYKICIPKDSPAYAIEAVVKIFNVNKNQFIYFDALTDKLQSDNLIVPSLLHNSYYFHPLFDNFMQDAAKSLDAMRRAIGRKVYLSRAKYRSRSLSVQRLIHPENDIETAFASAGYEIVHPEDLSLSEQIALYQECSVVAGEAGSALHNTLFAPSKTVVISLSNINDVQPKISEFKDQPLIIVAPISVEKQDGREVQNFDMGTIVTAIERAAALAAEKPMHPF